MKEKFCSLLTEIRGRTARQTPLNSKNLTTEILITQIVYCFDTVPGDHLLLFVGGTATAAQVLAGCGQEVEMVVLKSLIYHRKQHLERRN